MVNTQWSTTTTFQPFFSLTPKNPTPTVDAVFVPLSMVHFKIFSTAQHLAHVYSLRIPSLLLLPGRFIICALHRHFFSILRYVLRTLKKHGRIFCYILFPLPRSRVSQKRASEGEKLVFFFYSQDVTNSIEPSSKENTFFFSLR